MLVISARHKDLHFSNSNATLLSFWIVSLFFLLEYSLRNYYYLSKIYYEFIFTSWYYLSIL